MAKLIMLIGLPGCGKSTFIRTKLDAADNFTIISSDDILEELALRDGLTYDESFAKNATFAGKEMLRRAKAAIAAGHNVVWDQTNMSPKARRSKLEMFPSAYEKQAVVFSLTDEELKRRAIKRKGETGKFIPAHVMRSMANSYQAPTKAEGFDSIRYIRD